MDKKLFREIGPRLIDMTTEVFEPNNNDFFENIENCDEILETFSEDDYDFKDNIPLSSFCNKDSAKKTELRPEWLNKPVDLDVGNFTEIVGVADVIKEVTNPTPFKIFNLILNTDEE
ncbi:hypothetical protein FQA39_LY14990 [Lamprigera yunnana]|nr:hypothetical protein FQA39_LY14990 [Lamprigera yunnana]